MLSNSENIMKFQILNKLVFKKYRILKQISEGVFGQIYLVINEKTKKFYEMRTEYKDSNVHILEYEAYNLYSLKGLGIPELITFGKIKNYNILIEELLGKSLMDLFIENNYKFSIKDICLISLQLIDRIESVHIKTLIHRDIKPDNFLIGLEEPNVIFLTNFGLATKYCSSKTGKHILPGFRGTFTGTLKFCSSNAQRGNQLSRRDDMESLGYTILYLLKGKLPWQNLNQNFNEKEIYIKTYAMKKYMPIKRLCKGCPKELENFFKHVRSLKFQEEPNYDYLRKIFKIILKNNNFQNFENLNFSWIEDSQSIKAKIKKKRTLSPKSRLYYKIKNQIRIKNELNSDHNYIISNLLYNNKQNNIKNNINQSLSLTKFNNKDINNRINEFSKINQGNILSFNYDKTIKNNEKENIIKTDREKEIIQNKEKPKYIDIYSSVREKNNKYLNEKKMVNYTQISDNLNKKQYKNSKLIDMNQINNIPNLDKTIKIKNINKKGINFNIHNNQHLLTDNHQINYKKIKNIHNKDENNRIYPFNELNLNDNSIEISHLNKEDKIMSLDKYNNKRYYYIKNNDYMITDQNINNPKSYFKKINNKINSRGRNEFLINENIKIINFILPVL